MTRPINPVIWHQHSEGYIFSLIRAGVPQRMWTERLYVKPVVLRMFTYHRLPENTKTVMWRVPGQGIRRAEYLACCLGLPSL